MRRRLAVLVYAVTVLALGGCGAAIDGDGDLTDDWALPPAPTGFTPAAKTCHEVLDEPATRDSYAPVDCGRDHTTETVHVGQISGQPGTAAKRPVKDQLKDPYQECSTKADEFLGGPWRSGRLGIHVVLPSERAWSGGARWFRCDVQELDLDTGRSITRTSSLGGALGGGAPVKLRCFNPKVENDDVKGMAAVACDQQHHSEFAGTWDAPDSSYAALRADWDATQKGCWSAIAKFAGVPDNGDLKYRTGVISTVPFEADWEMGERRVQCFLWLSDKSLTRSLAGSGTKGLPINYA